MLESRNTYFPSENENIQVKKEHKKGWGIHNFAFATSQMCGGKPVNISVKACDYSHAIKKANKWANEENFEIIGNAQGYEGQEKYLHY